MTFCQPYALASLRGHYDIEVAFRLERYLQGSAEIFLIVYKEYFIVDIRYLSPFSREAGSLLPARLFRSVQGQTAW